MLRLLTIALTALAGAVASAAIAQPAPWGEYRPGPAYDAVVTSQYVTMRDGVRLAVSLHRPARNGVPVEGQFPVIWTGTLNIGAPGVYEAATQRASGYGGVPGLARHGYVVAQVARRGAGASFGTRRGYQDRTEAYDAYEMTEWLAAQPWSTGAIGVYGCSNTGEAALHAMTVAPPHLKAAWAGCFSWSKYDGFTRGGVIANWGTGPTRTREEDMRATPVQGDEDKRLLSQAVDEHAASTDLFALMKSMPFRDSWSPLVMSRFWYEGSAGTYADQLRRARIPLYIQAGWADDFRREGFVTLANLPETRLVIGPWEHCASGDFNLIGEIQRYFDHHLKGIDSGLAALPPVHYAVANAPAGSEWRSTRAWPLPQAQDTRLFLAPAAAGGALQRAPVRAARGAAFTVNYAADCPGTGNRPAAFRNACHIPGEGAVFRGPALTVDTEVTGHPLVDLWITSSAPEASLFVFLEDVAPDGKVTVISDGRQRASLRKLHTPPYPFLGLPWHRSWREDAEPLKAGEPTRVQFDILPAGHVFRRGHRIQVTVRGADPRERERQQITPAPTLTVLGGGRHASSVTLPVVGAS